MATLMSRFHDFAAAVATAINARSGLVGASAYELAVLNGYTGTQAQWLRGSAPREMTTAQRQALTGADLWDRRKVLDTNSGITWIYSTTGGYWFCDHGLVALIRGAGAANVAVAQTTVAAVPLEATFQNDDGNNYVVTNGAAPLVQIMRGGLYHVHGTVLLTQDTVNYAGALILDGASGTPGVAIREQNQTTNNARIAVDADIRVTEGASQKLRLGVYFAGTGGTVQGASGIQHTYFSISRVGD